MTVQTENEYEDLLSLWSDLESGLGMILGSPDSTQEFEQRVWQYDRWMQDLLRRDPDLGLYLLFQLATNSPVGYSASHALISAVLCHLIAKELGLPKTERDSLVHAALTMNMAMTGLQDQLAEQMEKPSGLQLAAISAHAAKTSLMLANLGVMDELWLDTVNLHHDESTDKGELRVIPTVQRLARILRMVDRYAAMISPRKTREGRSATDSMRSIITNSGPRHDEVGHALVRAVGLCPPGTYVRLDSSEVAVVVRRSNQPNLPHVAIVLNEGGMVLNPPRLHRTAISSPRIKAALATSAIRQRFNHHLILGLA
ncbi:MAG: phosphodiesterase [Rhodoferax sp.]|uniref:HD-GYP domain-containing protein n=1 Tax=Rhodoferax sp. TaxID=50421 RepID=UPI00262EBE05|nr:phosphodiesterase [Rhodoferax sp.]MDD5334177.1 phosphodiesterase [Rhodoferax sp.]